jgi:hypothetical protein
MQTGGLRSGDISEYYIIRRSTRDALVKAVMKAIREGWQPVGGAMHDGKYYCQTVIKRRP